MKKLTIVKQSFFAAIALAGMNIFSSCDSCSRKNENTEEITTDMNVDADTTAYDDSADSGSGMNDGTNTSRSIKSTSGSGTATTKPATSSSSASSSTTSSGTKKSGLTEEEITNQIENSDAKSDKNGKPIRSSGDAGSGQGTGTGSTGNNSRVTTKEAQKGN